MKIVALAGGVGGAKLALGLYRTMKPRDLTVIVNTGDDIVLHGLYISPDPDIVTYTLAGVVNPEAGWGYRDETFHAMERLKNFGGPDWFNLGDKDLATHIRRTEMLRGGATLSDAAETIRAALGVKARVLPMSDSFAPTYLETTTGRLHLQEYLIKHRAEPVLRAIDLSAAAKAEPAPGVVEAIAAADRIVICPSNPLISIGPILAVPGIREALMKRRENVVAVSPLVGGKSLKGPSDKMLRELGSEASPLGVARLYSDVAAVYVLDREDSVHVRSIEGLDVKAVCLSIVMRSDEDKEKLARDICALIM